MKDPPPRLLAVFCLTVCAVCALGRAPIALLADDGAGLEERPAPIAKLNELRPVVRDGWYNAFTDLTRWKDYYWLGYRRGTYHNQVRGNTDAIVMRSNDLVRWLQAKVFECPDGIANGCGMSRPAFAPTEERLYAFVPAQTPLEGSLRGRVYVTWTADGVSWSPLRLTTAGEHHPYLYRVRHHDGKFYSTRHIPEIVPGARDGDFDLVVSDDGISWRKHARIARGLSQGSFTEESDLCWLPDGELWCVVRASYGARFFRSRPPYTQWSRDVNIGKCDAPVLCVQGGQVYLAGRGRGGYQGTTVLWHLTPSGARRILTFPAGGDASYPGIVALQEPDTWIREVQGQLILSFYSDVAYHSGELKPRYFPKYRYKYSANDIFIAEVELQPTNADASAIQVVESDAGFQFKEGEKDVLFYQRAPKSLDGEFTRSNYVHPLYDLAGNVMTEDFPADHRHHRGIFWAWHQVRVGQRNIGDSWWTRDFAWDVVDASVDTGHDSSSLTVDVLWKSPDWTDDGGKQKPLVKERTTIRVHAAENDARRIDFEVRLLALEEDLRIGGSEDAKGYGGFSTRIRLPEDVRFQNRDGDVTPQRTTVDGGAWMDIVGTFGPARFPSGMAILCHPSVPDFPQGWLLRKSGSMQNPVYPGREPVLLSTKEPLVLRYRLVLHRGRVDRETIDRWHAEYARDDAAEPTSR